MCPFPDRFVKHLDGRIKNFWELKLMNCLKMSSCMVVVVKHPIAYRNRTRSSPKWQPTWIDPSTSTAASTWAHLPNCYSHQQRLLQSSLHHQQPLHPRQLQARLSSYQKKVNKLCLFLLRNCFACILFYGTMPYSLGNC